MNAHNLKPCKPGETHNPKGSSKKAKLAKIFRDSITDVDREVVYQKAKSLAMRGVPFFVELFLDRDEGKVPNKTQLSGEGGKPIELTIVATSQEKTKQIDALRKKLSGE